MALQQTRRAVALFRRDGRTPFIPLPRQRRHLTHNVPDAPRGRCNALPHAGDLQDSSPAVLLQEIGEHTLIGVTTRACTLAQAVAELLRAEPGVGAEEATALELIRLGAAYVGEEIKGQGYTKWRRVLSRAVGPDTRMAPGTRLRCHPRPKRFLACSATDWPARVLHDGDGLLVLDKPAGLPCMPHESNGAEHVAACAGRALGHMDVEVGHRLDAWTTGVVVCTTHKQANRAFKAALSEPGKATVRKWYRALTWRPVPPGVIATNVMHWMYDGPFGAQATAVLGSALPPRGPRLLSSHALPGWKLSQLVVEACVPCPEAQGWLTLAGLRDSRTSVGHSTTPPYELTIRLVTGRTHQIRAQLACGLGCSLVGDVMYERIAGVLVEDQDDLLRQPALASEIQTLPVLSGPIGLHAWKMEWVGVHPQWVAPVPWRVAARDEC